MARVLPVVDESRVSIDDLLVCELCSKFFAYVQVESHIRLVRLMIKIKLSFY